MVAYYNANTAYITKKFCENKDKPVLKCNGKCYLKKQLDKVDAEGSSEESEKNTIKIVKVESPVFFNNTTLKYYYTEEEDIELNTAYTANYSFTHLSSCFHPPDII